MNQIEYSNVVLSGVPGSGKSTVGKHLSLILGMGLLDLDAYIEKIQGRSIKDIWKSEGEDVFRVVEREAIHSIANIKSHVICLGGGTLQTEDTVKTVKQFGPLIWLKPASDEVARRLFMKVTELENRPVFAEFVQVADKDTRRKLIKERVEELSSKRSAFYEFADIILDGGYVTPETSACQLKELMDVMGYKHGSTLGYDYWRGQE